MDENRRFQAALSFAAENRDFVKEVARCLVEMLDINRVFLNENYSVGVTRSFLSCKYIH